VIDWLRAQCGSGNVMMWGCIFWEGIGYATRIEGKVDAELYCSILYDELQQSLDHYDKSPSSKTTTPSTGANGLKSGLQTMGTLL
jgi:hypothetical protein